MGKTYQKQTRQFDEDSSSSQRSRKGKPKHSTNRKGEGMRTLNRYVDGYYDFDDTDFFEDEIGLYDEIHIKHITNKQR